MRRGVYRGWEGEIASVVDEEEEEDIFCDLTLVSDALIPYRISSIQRTVLPFVSCTIVSGVLLYIYIQGCTR